MRGKQKCKILKEIRQRIADENDIPYVTRECGFQGECSGTCPRCESELRYLEQQLALRASLGKRVAVAALCAGRALRTAGCAPAAQKQPGPSDRSGAVAIEEPLPTEDPELFVTTGEVAPPEETEAPAESTPPADPSAPPVTPVPIPEEIELMGDVAYFPEAEQDG